MKGKRVDNYMKEKEKKIHQRIMIRSQLVSQLIHVLSMVPDSGAI